MFLRFLEKYFVLSITENVPPFIGTKINKEIFENSLGKEFDINGLASGEKQLFLRGLSLKFLEANNSIILIDEPEISLHPEWQQKIIKVYENIGINNQLIIATHSPHIVGDIKALVTNKQFHLAHPFIGKGGISNLI